MAALSLLETDRAAALEAAGSVDDDLLRRFDMRFPRLHDLLTRLPLPGEPADGR
jgi:hypothetical protein